MKAYMLSFYGILAYKSNFKKNTSLAHILIGFVKVATL